MNKIIKAGMVVLGTLGCTFGPIAGYQAYQKYCVERWELIQNPVLGYGNPRALYSAENPNQRYLGLHKVGEVTDQNIKIERSSISPLAHIVTDGLGNIKTATLYLPEGTDIPKYCPIRR